MSLVRVTAPTVTPVLLDEQRSHMRVYHRDDDDYIESLLAAATEWVETFTRRALITQTWRWKQNSFSWCMEVPRPPLQSVTAASFTYIAGDGTVTQVPESVYEVDTDSEPGRVYLAYSQSWPTPRSEQLAVSMTYVAGYGATGAAVPAPIRHAIMLHAAHLYEHREPVIAGVMATRVPDATHSLLYPYQMPVFA